MLNLSLLYNIYDTYIWERRRQHLLERAFSIQQIDSTYDSVNFDDPISTLSYFKKIQEGYTRISGEKIDRMIRHFKKNGSKISAEVQAHHIMRSAAEKIHVALREPKGEDLRALYIAENILLDVLIEAWNKLQRLLRDCDVEHEEVNFSKYRPVG